MNERKFSLDKPDVDNPLHNINGSPTGSDIIHSYHLIPNLVIRLAAVENDACTVIYNKKNGLKGIYLNRAMKRIIIQVERKSGMDYDTYFVWGIKLIIGLKRSNLIR